MFMPGSDIKPDRLALIRSKSVGWDIPYHESLPLLKTVNGQKDLNNPEDYLIDFGLPPVILIGFQVIWSSFTHSTNLKGPDPQDIKGIFLLLFCIGRLTIQTVNMAKLVIIEALVHLRLFLRCNHQSSLLYQYH